MSRRRCRSPLVLAAALASFASLALPARHAAAQGVPGCAARGVPCAEVGTFVATVGDFRTSTAGRYRVVTLTVRFQNKTNRQLRLGYVQGSGVVLDDQGNRYVVGSAANVRAIGEITANSFDPKFVLEPGETSDARFELAWQPERANQIVGTTFEGDLTVREIDPVAGNQLRLGREHALHFRALGSGTVAAGEPAPASPMSPASPASPAPATPVNADGDPCLGRTRCFATGPFMAQITSVTAGPVGGRHHGLRIEMRIQNRSAEPIILGYKSGTSGAIDDLGNRYYYGRPSTHDVSFHGIGLVTGTQADPQFALRPGESRNATFDVIRYEVLNKQLGTSWSYDVVLAQLEVLPSNQVRAVRDYSVSFQGLTTGAAPNAAAAIQQGRALIDRLRGKKP